MKKLLSSKIVCMLVFAAVFLLSACSSASSVNTSFHINKDFSGSRDMDISLNDSAISQNYSGSIEDIQAVVEENIPDELTWSYDESGFHVSLSFSSLEDYQRKVKAITGEEKNIDIRMPQTVWANGIYISENFTSEDLLNWFRTAMVDGGHVDQNNAEYILSLGDTKVVFEGEEIVSGAQIYVDKMESLSIDTIDFLTEVKSIDDYNRRIVFIIPSESMNKKGDEIKAFFKERTPQSVELKEESDKESKTIFTFQGTGLDKNALEKFDQTIFGKNNVYFNQVESEDGFSPFVFSEDFSEKIIFDDFRAGTEQIQTNAFLKIPDGFDFKANGQYYSADEDFSSMYSDMYEGYLALNRGILFFENYEYAFSVYKAYKVSEINIVTGKNFFNDKWTRECEFVFDGTPSEEDMERILADIRSRVKIEEEETEAKQSEAKVKDEETEKESEKVSSGAKEEESEIKEESKDKKVSLKVEVKEVKNKDKQSSIKIKQSGNFSELEEAALLLFDTRGNTVYEKEKGVFSPRHKEAFSEELDFSRFVGKIDDTFRVNYTLKLGFLSKMDYYESTGDDSFMQSGKFQSVYREPFVNFMYVGSGINILSILFLFFVLLALISVMILLLGRIIKKNKKEKKDEVEKTANVDMQSAENLNKEENGIEEEKSTSQTQFSEVFQKKSETEESRDLHCKYCNALIKENSVYCENCGKKLQ